MYILLIVCKTPLYNTAASDTRRRVHHTWRQTVAENLLFVCYWWLAGCWLAAGCWLRTYRDEDFGGGWSAMARRRGGKRGPTAQSSMPIHNWRSSQPVPRISWAKKEKGLVCIGIHIYRWFPLNRIPSTEVLPQTGYLIRCHGTGKWQKTVGKNIKKYIKTTISRGT